MTSKGYVAVFRRIDVREEIKSINFGATDDSAAMRKAFLVALRTPWASKVPLTYKSLEEQLFICFGDDDAPGMEYWDDATIERYFNGMDASKYYLVCLFEKELSRNVYVYNDNLRISQEEW